MYSKSYLYTIACNLLLHQHGNNWLVSKGEVVGLAGSPDQAYAKELAERGYVTLAPDAICFEERASAADPILYHAFQLHKRLMKGQTLINSLPKFQFMREPTWVWVSCG